MTATLRQLLPRPFLAIFGLLLDRPMRYFYRFGFWRGLPESDICASLSRYDSAFWTGPVNAAACADLIDRQVHSFDVWIVTAIYFACLGMTIFQLFASLVRLPLSLSLSPRWPWRRLNADGCPRSAPRSSAGPPQTCATRLDASGD